MYWDQYYYSFGSEKKEILKICSTAAFIVFADVADQDGGISFLTL